MDLRDWRDYDSDPNQRVAAALHNMAAQVLGIQATEGALTTPLPDRVNEPLTDETPEVAA